MPFNRWPVHERVLANLANGTAIDGLLIARKGPLLIFADATLFSPETEPTPLDGEVYIERTRVLYLQSSGPPDRH